MAMKIVKCGFCEKELKRYPSKTDAYYCNLKCKADWQILQREKLGYTKEWLIDQYIVQRKSADQIASEIGRDPKRVWEWLKSYDIETRPRGNEYQQGYKKGDPNWWTGKTHPAEFGEKLRQIRLEDGHVPYLQNGKHWMRNEGARKPASWKGGITPERQAFYSSLEWKSLIGPVWKRDNATCQKCQKYFNDDKTQQFHIHHIVSFQCQELRAVLTNLILLCRGCHLWVHSRKNTNKDFIKEYES